MQFVSEKEIEEVKIQRQKEWEKVRRPDQPLQRPEEEYDHRTLYEKLKAQKDQKQEEWEEQFKFKNMIYKGLNDEEATFLQTVADRQAQIDSEKRQAENEELLSYREAVEKLKEEESLKEHRLSSTNPAPPPPSASSAFGSSAPAKAHKSQLSLIAKSIKTKRKRSSTDDAEDKSSEVSPEKKLKVESDSASPKEGDQHPPAPSSSSSALLGLAAYSSSDSEDSGD